MITVKRNHFYKKQPITANINVRPQYPDLPDTPSITFKMGTNRNENIYLMGTTVPDLPTYGDAEQVGARINLFSSDIEMKDNRNAPDIRAYRLTEDLTLKEGGVAASDKGDRLSLYSVHPINPTPYLEEDFEGNPEDLDTINRMGTNNVVTSSEAYITEKNLMRLIEEQEGGPVSRYNRDNFLKQVEKIDGEMTRFKGNTRGYKCRVSWANSNHTKWKVRPSYNRILFKTKLYKYFDWEWSRTPLIQFNVTRAAAGNIDSTPQATVGNTVFNDFYATRNFSNPYDASETDPLILSNIDLSSENALNGGQSLRFYHNWGYSPYNEQLQVQIGSEKNVNPQTSRASLYDIPFPSLPFDFARTTMDSESSTKVLGATHGVVPEIRLPMNITKLGPNVLVAGEDYSQGGGTVEPPLTKLKLFYGSTTSADAESPTYASSLGAPASKFEQTFLRSVVVTFSNYKPKPEHTTVDKFLAYGLRNFYRGKNFDNIVGGYVITRFGIDGLFENSENCYAFPLPVSRIPQQGAYASGTASDTYVQKNGGLAQFDGTGDMANIDILTWGRTNFLSVPENETTQRFVELPMNSWFTSRIFTDIYQHNNSGSFLKRPYAPSSSANPSYGSDSTFAEVAKRGAPMRVIFETDSANQNMIFPSGAGTYGTLTELDGSPVNSNVRNLPFLDIPFPIGDSSNSAAALKTDTYNFADNPELYPKHMTIWVQNYCWVSGNVQGTSLNGKYETLFPVGDSMVTTSGAAREAEVFIDSVKLLNYEPEVRNITANNNNSALTFKSDKFLSPLATRYKDTTNDEYIGSSWVQGNKISRTVMCVGTNGSKTVRIKNPQEFDTTFLENACKINSQIQMSAVTSSYPNAFGFEGDTRSLDTIESLDTFTVNANLVATGDIPITFTSNGTILPRINKADLIEYNAGQALVLGFNNTGDLPVTTTSSATGFVLFNDFITSDWSAMSTDPVLPNKTQTQQGGSIYGGIFSQATSDMDIDKLGGQLLGDSAFIAGTNQSNISGAAYKVDGSAVALTSGTALGTGSNNDFISVDGFRQKGFAKVAFTGSDATAFGKWVKRENILLSTRVTNCRDKSFSNNDKIDGYKDDLAVNQLRVKNINIFNYFDDEETYVLYLVGDADTTASKKTGLILDRTKLPTNNIVEFTNLTTFADDGTTALVTEDNLYRLMICPEKFSFSFLFDTPSSRIKRSYTSAVTVGSPGGGTYTPSMSSLSTVSGTTFNEFTFNYDSSPTGTGGATGLYKNVWSLAPDVDNPTVITDRDYGYGTFDEETGLGGEFFKGPAYLDTYNTYKISNFDIEPNSNLNMALYYYSDVGLEEMIKFRSRTYGVESERPALYVKYKDLPPVINDFRVSPAVNTLEQNYNYYELGDSNLNAVKFNWSEENADDIWYRILMVDTVPIKNKYHKAVGYVPLNEPVAKLSSDVSGSIFAFNMTTGFSTNDSTKVTIGSSVRKVVEGQGGYGVVLANSAAGRIKVTGDSDIHYFEDSPTEYTLVLHWTPSADDDGVVARVFSVGTVGTTTVGTGALLIYKNTSNQIVVVTQGATENITGSSVVKCDGSTPTSIILTYDKNATFGDDAKLYIDGKLEGSSNLGQVTTTPAYIGGEYNSGHRGSTGVFEEFIVYHKCYKVVESSNQYIYNTVDEDDLVTHNAVLFAADYHNFRGTSRNDIGMSSTTSWRTTIA